MNETKEQYIAKLQAMNSTKYNKWIAEHNEDREIRRVRKIKAILPAEVVAGSRHPSAMGAEPAHTAAYFTAVKNSQYVRDLNKHCADLKKLFVYGHDKGLYEPDEASPDYSFIPTPGTNPTQSG